MFYFLQIAYSALGAVVSLVSLILIAMAYGLARRRQNQGLLSWLLPLLIAHSISTFYWLFVCAFQWLGLRATLTSELVAFACGAITGLIDIYAVVRLLSWVRTFLQDQKNEPWNQRTPTQGVWPPPPNPPGS